MSDSDETKQLGREILDRQIRDGRPADPIARLIQVGPRSKMTSLFEEYCRADDHLEAERRRLVELRDQARAAYHQEIDRLLELFRNKQCQLLDGDPFKSEVIIEGWVYLVKHGLGGEYTIMPLRAA